MPPVLIPVAAAAVASGAAAGLGIITVNAALVTIGATALSAGASYMTAKKPTAAATPGGDANFTTAAAQTAQIGSPAAAGMNSERGVAVRQTLPPRRYVYGRCRVGGAVLFQGVDENGGSQLLIMSALSDGAIDTVEKYYLGEEEIVVDGSLEGPVDTKYYGMVKFEFSTGGTSQATSALMAAHVPTVGTVNFRQRGVARAVARLKWGSDSTHHNYVYGEGTAPSYLIRGVKVYDPREVGHNVNDPTTWEYSNNPALCVAHAMTNAWQSAIPNTILDWTSVATAANDCDAGGFELAGIVQSDAPLAGQLADMLTSFGGAITFEDGLYSIRAEKARSSVWTATDADIKALGEMQFEADAAVYFDAIKGVYYDAAGDGRRLTSPVQVLGGGARETSIDLPFVDSSRNAQVLVFRKLTYDRDGGLISITFSDAALSLVPTEVFTISSVAFPFANGNWQVIQIDVADVGCIVAARRYVSGAYVDPATYVL